MAEIGSDRTPFSEGIEFLEVVLFPPPPRNPELRSHDPIFFSWESKAISSFSAADEIPVKGFESSFSPRFPKGLMQRSPRHAHIFATTRKSTQVRGRHNRTTKGRIGMLVYLVGGARGPLGPRMGPRGGLPCGVHVVVPPVAREVPLGGLEVLIARQLAAPFGVAHVPEGDQRESGQGNVCYCNEVIIS